MNKELLKAYDELVNQVTKEATLKATKYLNVAGFKSIKDAKTNGLGVTRLDIPDLTL